MQTTHTIAQMRTALAPHRARTIALVPTMGALHAGHLSLVRAARQQAGLVVATIFVNPLQFAPTEDLDRYPRTFEADQALLDREGVDFLFAPTVAEMYPSAAATYVDVPGIAERLDGASRPGHFRGVATVVAKLFHIVQPQRAFFGQKDAAQVAVLQAMVRDLNFPVELVVCPTVRDPDGLALSSRNRFLSPSERAQALALPQALNQVRQALTQAPQTPQTLREILLTHLTSPAQATSSSPTPANPAGRLTPADPAARTTASPGPIPTNPALVLDYAEIVHPQTLLPLNTLKDGALVAVSATIGRTRLIDNLLLPETLSS